MGEVWPLALAIAASPFPIVPVILLLFTPRARATSSAFLGGWLAGIAVVTTVAVLLAEVVESRDYAPTWASVTRIVLGLALVGLGIRQWLTRGDSDDVPAWMASLDSATPGTAVRLSLALSALNPKIVLLAASAGLAIGSSEGPAAQVAAWTVAFTLLAGLGVAIPVLLFLVAGPAVLRPLAVVRDWLQRNNSAITAIVITVIGAVLVAKGIGEL